MAENRIWKIVVDDFAEGSALLRHSACAPLAETHSVALAGAFQDDIGAVIVFHKIIAEHGVPSESPGDR